MGPFPLLSASTASDVPVVVTWDQVCPLEVETDSNVMFVKPVGATIRTAAIEEFEFELVTVTVNDCPAPGVTVVGLMVTAASGGELVTVTALVSVWLPNAAEHPALA
jgi:hypothetical protein